MFGVIKKLKAFKKLLSNVLTSEVEDLTDEGYDAEKIDENTIRVNPSPEDNVEDIEDRLEDDFPESTDDYDYYDDDDDDDESWLPVYFKFRHRKDHRVCEDCRNFGDTYIHKLELRRDGTGNLHTGGDEDIIEFLLKDSAYTIQDLALQPQTVSLNLHMSQRGEPEYIESCRCVLALVT
jgi:hypothetical protein